MKRYYLLGIISFLMNKYGSGEHIQEDMEDECALQLGITEDDWLNDSVNDTQMHCLAECVFKKIGTIDETGFFHEKKLTDFIIMTLDSKSEFDRKMGPKIVSQCVKIANKESDENCNRMMVLMDCFDEWEDV